MMQNKRIEIKSAGLKGLGVFTLDAIKAGEVVVCGQPISLTNKRTDYSFQTGLDRHVELDEPARRINHSCNPNLGIRNNEVGGYDFIAIRASDSGEELTWDYCTTEYVSIAIKGTCLCNSAICRKRITGYKSLPENIKQKYRNYVADYLK